jgi:hypothetical protein
VVEDQISSDQKEKKQQSGQIFASKSSFQVFPLTPRWGTWATSLQSTLRIFLKKNLDFFVIKKHIFSPF